MKKCIILLSGGLDSRLAVKIMQEKRFEVIAFFFKLPFAKDNLIEIKKFVDKQKIALRIFDCTRGKLLKDYLEIIKKPKYSRGAGINPCIDCRLFLLKKTKEFAKKENTDIIVTGEVEGQRPLSQTKKALKIIDREFISDIKRPLIELGINGRRREAQMKLAEKYKIDYPHPAGGCLLCEKSLKERFKSLLKYNLINENSLQLVSIGRHFMIEKSWIILGRNEKENKIIESNKSGKLIIPDYPAPSIIIINSNKKAEKLADKLIRAYSKKSPFEERKKFDKFKL